METMSKKYDLRALGTDSAFVQVTLRASRDCADYVRQFYFDDIEIYESFFILMLNQANMTIGWAKISQGGVTGTVAGQRLVREALLERWRTRGSLGRLRSMR